MKYKCPICETKFSVREAYCEDWRVKEKSFGCPSCKTFFQRKVRGDLEGPTEKRAVVVLLVVIAANFIVGMVWPDFNVSKELAIIAFIAFLLLLYWDVRTNGWKQAFRRAPGVRLEPIEKRE